MNISIYKDHKSLFDTKIKAGGLQYWSSLYPPQCKKGDELKFFYLGNLLGYAKVVDVFAPCVSDLDRKGIDNKKWRIVFDPQCIYNI